MTSHTTIIYIRTSSDSRLTGLGSEPEMTLSESDPPLSILTNKSNPSLNSHNPPSIDLSRKSNEKTISGLFTYTDGTDLEPSLADNKLDTKRGLKTSNLASSASPTASAAGGSNGGPPLSNGMPKGASSIPNGASRPRSHSKPESMRSIGSQVERQNRLSKGDHTFDSAGSVSSKGGDAPDPRRSKPMISRSFTDGSGSLRIDPVQQSSSYGLGPLQAEPSEISPTLRQPGSSVHRFSSPPRMTQMPPGVLDTAPHPSLSLEAPRVTQRHTLQIPRANTTRDFSFSTGDEAVSTGRFSPIRAENEAPGARHRRPSLGLGRRTTRSMASDAYPDEVPPDEDAARWTELIKQKRASRRKRREEEDDDRVVVGKKVEEGHVNWVTAYNMLTGIRFTVSRTNAKIDRELTDADFDAKHKFSFDVTGNELTPSAKYDFKFKDYSPWVFRHLRAIFGLDPADYLMSLTSKYILSELGSPGKSGSFFYFSRDYKYIIKTIHHAEHKLLRHILRDYYKHVRENPNTLISQFYGLHRVKIPYGRKIHFVVMNNLFPPHRDIHQTFDLKGSTVGRDFKEEDLENNPRATLKDLNWLRRDLHLEFQHQVKKMFLDQIQRDVALLQKLHIMDYSLLVGMHDVEKGNDENLRATILQVYQPGGEREEDAEPKGAPLLRTPSRLESARKARELRQTLKKQKPTPMSLTAAQMPDELKDSDVRNRRIFYSDDGGIRATHEDGTAGDMVYYLGIIDCLTHYGFVKRLEHFWKGLSNSRTQISPIPPQNYGDRFVSFITGITMTKEEVERRKTLEGDDIRESIDAHNVTQHRRIPSISRISADGASTRTGPLDDDHPPRSPVTVDRTMRKAHRQVEKTSQEDDRPAEEELPDRKLQTITMPAGNTDRGADASRNSTTLPVVQEVGEGSSEVSSRRSDRAASESRETDRAGSRSGPNTAQDVTYVSSSSVEHTESSQTDEKSSWPTPASEYFTPTSPNFSRPIFQSPHLEVLQAGQTRTGIYRSPSALDPEKSVIGDDGRPVEGVERLPGLGVDGLRHNTVR